MRQLIKTNYLLKNLLCLFGLLILLQANVFSQRIDPDNTIAAAKQLEFEQETLRNQFKNSAIQPEVVIERMLDLGLFEEAEKSVSPLKQDTSFLNLY